MLQELLIKNKESNFWTAEWMRCDTRRVGNSSFMDQEPFAEIKELLSSLKGSKQERAGASHIRSNPPSPRTMGQRQSATVHEGFKSNYSPAMCFHLTSRTGVLPGGGLFFFSPASLSSELRCRGVITIVNYWWIVTVPWLEQHTTHT